MKYNEAAVQILNGNPGKFYIFAGTEYGIKELLLEKLEKHYGSNQISEKFFHSVTCQPP